MLNYKRLLTILVVLYCTVFLLTVFFSDPTDTAQNFVESNVAAFLQFEEELAKEAAPFKAPKLTFKTNPFARLGAYPDPIDYIDKPLYDVSQYSLYNDDDYCDQVDLYNLENPENMFENMNFFTDVKQENMLRHKVLGRIGKLHQSHLDKSMSKDKSRTRTDHLDKEINAFIISTYQFQRHYQIGKHFLCATQISNHIPNQTTLIKKGQVMQSIEDYALKYKDQPECFNKFAFSPKTYRLFVEEECKEFFNIINSEEYLDSLTTEPIQYVIKTGRDAHKGQGVDILNTTVADKINKKYDSGKKCGEDADFDVAQKYIANPLLLDKNNKFHMRVYMLIASSNPLIVYYQDGYIRAMITPYDKLSENKESHLTNLMVDDLNQAIKENRTINGMTPQELDEYQIWRLEELQDYLLETGRIEDTTWLDTHLRPTLQRAFVHLARMAGRYLWKQSNVYELLGCDFMMDDQLGVWFLEANSFPQVDGVKDDLITRMLEDLFEIEFGYYRSRMKRVIAVLQKMQEEAGDKPKKAELGAWKELYQEAMKNRFEPEFAIKETNSFKKIVDDSLPGAEAYFGLLSEECAQI